MEGTTKRGRGRPRSEASRGAVLEGARRLLDRDGFSGITVDTLAAEAGVGRQTIYRRWPTKADVVLELIADPIEFAIGVPDTGSYRDDLVTFLRTAFAAASQAATADLLRGLMAEAQMREEFGERFRREFLAPRLAAFRALVDRAIARGDFPSHVAPEVVADVAFGAMWYRLMATHAPLGADYADAIAQCLAPERQAHPV